jgi:hypothetical protein
MKIFAWFFISILAATALLSIYRYLLDVLMDNHWALNHPAEWVLYWVYFVMTRTWLIAGFMLLYLFLFKRDYSRLIYRLLFVVTAAVLLAFVSQLPWSTAAENASIAKNFLAYLFTGLTLMWFHVKT